MQITPGTGPQAYIKFLRYDHPMMDALIYGFEVPRPSNFHAHLRRGPLMRAIAKPLMQHVYYLLVMPNTGPIRTLEELTDYFHGLRALAQECGCGHVHFVMTLYYTALITPEVIGKIKEVEEKLGIRIEIKWYPPEPGTTTESGHGIPLEAGRDEFLEMERLGVPLLVHPESVRDKHNRTLSPFEGEGYFFQHVLAPFRDRHSDLMICGEHVNTKEGVEWVKADEGGNSLITITPHGVLCTMHDLDGPFGALLKCKTRLQTPENRDAVEAFMVSGDARCGAGDDTAAHLKRTKLGVPFEQAANGVFWTSGQTFAGYAKVFNRCGALDDRFVDFTAHNAADWRGLPRPARKDVVRFVLNNMRDIPDPIEVPEEEDVVLPAGWADTTRDRMQLGLICTAV